MADHAHADPHAAEHSADAWDPTDPHGQYGGHHGHHIASWQMLVVVLLALMFFTVLTVAISRAEVWFAAEFNVLIPDWVNVMIAMSIATIKASMVCMYFMALKYDNPMNTVILITTIFAFACFMGFTAIDLGNRGRLYDYRGPSVVAGGTGNAVIMRDEAQLGPDGKPLRDQQGNLIIDRNVAITVPIYQHAKDRLLAAVGPEKYAELQASHHHDDHGHDAGRHLPDANHAKARYGLTPGLFDDHAPADHHDAQGEHADDAHAPPADDH